MDRTYVLGLILAGIVPFVALPHSAMAQAQRGGTNWSFAVETEPVAYALDGAGGTLAHRTGPWTVSLEGFALTMPESLHGNEGFESSTSGVQLQVERFLDGGSDGFYVGPEIGIFELEVTREESGATGGRVGVSAGARVGYHWQTGLGGLYLSPVAGLGYSFGTDDVVVDGASYGRSAVTPWATVGFGWVF